MTNRNRLRKLSNVQLSENAVGIDRRRKTKRIKFGRGLVWSAKRIVGTVEMHTERETKRRELPLGDKFVSTNILRVAGSTDD